MEKFINKKRINPICILNSFKTKNSCKNKAPDEKIINKITYMIILKILNGLQTWCKWIKPVAPVTNTASALVILSSKLKLILNNKIIITLKKTVKLPGKLFLKIFTYLYTRYWLFFNKPIEWMEQNQNHYKYM